MTVAADVPAQPVLPPPYASSMRWAILMTSCLNEKLIGCPFLKGFPQAAGLESFVELTVIVEWDGSQFRCFAVDRRPLALGQDAVMIPLPNAFSIHGNSVTINLDAGQLAIPSSIQFRGATSGLAGILGSEGWFLVDAAPFAILQEAP
jgi:hypothetical protein